MVAFGGTVLVFHGYGGDERVARRLRRLRWFGWRVVAPSLGDHWGSAAAVEAARDLAVRSRRPLVVVGESMGALVAGRLADVADRIVLVSPVTDPAGLTGYWRGVAPPLPPLSPMAATVIADPDDPVIPFAQAARLGPVERATGGHASRDCWRRAVRAIRSPGSSP